MEEREGGSPDRGISNRHRSAPSPTLSLLVVGQLEHYRLLALNIETMTRQASEGGGPSADLEVQAGSATVGIPLAIHVPWGTRDVLVVTTTHAQMVRLHPDWRHREVLDFLPSLQGFKGPIRFSPIMQIDEDSVAVAITNADKLALAVVDLKSWRLTGTRVIADRSAVFPSSCASGNELIVATDGWIDRYDSSSLLRTSAVRYRGWASSLACDAQTLVAVSSDGPNGTIFNVQGLDVRSTFSWNGKDGGEGLYIHGDNIVGTDTTAGVLFVCGIRGGACRQTEPLGSRPTSALAVGDSVFVAMTGERAVKVIDFESLRVKGTVRLPSAPRGLAILPVAD